MSTRVLLTLVASAALLCLIGAVAAWPAFVRSWLTATLTWGALPLGAVAVLMTHGLTGGRWGDDSRPIWLALAASMPVFALALLPLLFALDPLFSWTRPESELPAVVARKTAYLNEPFFVLRTLVYLAIWLALPWLLGVWQRRPGHAVHAPGLIAWLLALTFFSYDWLLSLEPEFYTDILGLILAIGSSAACFAVGLLVSVRHLAPAVRTDLANIWLALLLGWVFLVFSQFIVIWSANLPHEIGWFLARREGPWPAVNAVALALFFVLPFAVLLSSAAKRDARWLTLAAASCLAGHVLYVQYLVLPAFDEQYPAQLWLGPAAVLALGAAFAWTIGRRLTPAAMPP
ncbi:MAG: hypothetical protein WD382_11800 [Halofilum sp. (in: g-proteobacteria)]